MKVRKIIGKIPVGKHGANVICKNGQKGIIHHKQINHEGKYYVYPYKNEFKPEIIEYKIISYF